jgi:transcription-repair coupling factor (superfamily II helicase)
MDIYRKIAVTKTTEDLKQIESELADVYGPVPDDVELLLELAGLRIKASKQGIKSIVASGRDLIFSFTKESGAKADSLFAKVKGMVKVADPKTVYLRLPPPILSSTEDSGEPKTLMNVLRKILSTNSQNGI